MEEITFPRFLSSNNMDINIDLLFKNVYKRYVTHLLFIKIACTVVFCWTILICNIYKWVKMCEIVSTLNYSRSWQKVDSLFSKFSILKRFFIYFSFLTTIYITLKARRRIDFQKEGYKYLWLKKNLTYFKKHNKRLILCAWCGINW